MTDMTALKAETRKAAFARRKAAAGRQAEEAATAHLLALLRAETAGAVAGYMKIRTEIDPVGAMTALVAAGRPVCVPVITGPGRPLAFRAWTPATEMIDGPFGARVPAAGSWITPAALIVPLLAFDRDGFRLGYGGGFYDRTLERLRAAAPVLAVGFAFAGQEMETVPTEPTDQRLDVIVTETGVIRP